MIAKLSPEKIVTSNPDPTPTPPQKSDSETLKVLQITNIRLEAAEKEKDLLNQRIGDKDVIIKTQGDQLSKKDEQIAELLKAVNARKEVNVGDPRIMDQANKLIEDQHQRINELEHPSLLSSIFDRRTLGGALVGTGLGYGICSIQSHGGSVSNLFNFTGSSGVQTPLFMPSYPSNFYQTDTEKKINQILKSPR